MTLNFLKTVAISAVVLVANAQLRNQIAYSESEAILALGYASTAGCNNLEVLISWTCNECLNGAGSLPAPNPLTDVVIFESDDEVTQGYVGYDAIKNRVVVSFQGTQSASQWLLDFQIGLREVEDYCDDCRVHSGFYHGYDAVGDDLLDYVVDLAASKQTSSVLFAGHSLGGALTSHAALHLELSHPGEYSIIGFTFGQPRMGNKEFASFFHDYIPNFFRVVNYKDIVPALPPEYFDLYYHVPREVYYYEEPNPGAAPGPYLLLNPDDGEDQDGQAGVCEFFSPCLSGNDHLTYLNHPDMSDHDGLC